MADDRKNLPTNRAQCTCSTSIVNSNGLGEEKGSCSEPTTHEENQINIACFTTSRNNEEYMSNPKRKSCWPKQRQIDFTRTSEGRLVLMK